MSRITRYEAIRRVKVVYELHDNISRFLNEMPCALSSSCKATSEINEFRSRAPLEFAYGQGQIQIEAAADHVVAFTRAVTEPVLTVAPWTCGRAVVESCGLSAWLLDPTIGPGMRVQRSLAFRYEGLYQQMKCARAANDKASMEKVERQIRKVERNALEYGFCEIKDKRGKRLGIAQQMPSFTEIVSQGLNLEVTYRILSAATHSHPWMLVQGSFQHVAADELGIGGSEEQRKPFVIEKALSVDAVALLCDIITRALYEPLRCSSQLFGWNEGEIKTLFDATFKNLKAVDPQC